MKLESLENYRKDTTSFKLFACIVILCSLAGNIIFYYLSQRQIEDAYDRIWVVDKDHRPYMAQARHTIDHEERIFEYEEAVREFYENAFSCDDSQITKGQKSENLERALHLSKEFVNGQTIDDIWSEENIIGNVLENSWAYSGRADSILFDMESRPVKGYAFGRQQIKMRRQTVTRNMHFTFVIYDAARRTRSNPFAIKIDQIDIFNNKVIDNKRE